MITRYIEFDDLEKISELYCLVFFHAAVERALDY